MFKLTLQTMGALLLSGCSFQATLDGMVSPVEQARYAKLAEQLCTNPFALRSTFSPDLIASLDAAVPKLPAECPDGPAAWRVTSYQFRTNNVNGQVERIDEVVLVGQGKTRWSTAEFRFHKLNDQRPLIVTWAVAQSSTPPPSLQFIDNYNRTVQAWRIGGPLALLALIGLTIWLIRWQRRRQP